MSALNVSMAVPDEKRRPASHLGCRRPLGIRKPTGTERAGLMLQGLPLHWLCVCTRLKGNSICRALSSFSVPSSRGRSSKIPVVSNRVGVLRSMGRAQIIYPSPRCVHGELRSTCLSTNAPTLPRLDPLIILSSNGFLRQQVSNLSAAKTSS